jgi:hypothetical protein
MCVLALRRLPLTCHCFGGPGSLILQELGNDVATNDTGPYDGEVCASGREVLSPVCVILVAIGVVLFPSLSISSPSPSVHLSHVAELVCMELLTFKAGRERTGVLTSEVT